jgi:2-dehydro-3-deoxyphosphogluconate aldolase/(4S)-4-hydroxy-2-oxoglutarate aldolase
MQTADEILRMAPVVPVLSIAELDQAVPLARALVAGGIPVLEVTLRTPAGLAAIRAISEQLPEAIVGAGTVINPAGFQAAVEAGSRFVVTPGLTDALLDAAADSDVPLIPGIATVGEMMTALDRGIECLKFFPAEAAGGVATLKAFAGPFPQVKFCPTGGVNLGNIASYLALDSVITVGGTWLTPGSAVAAGDWGAITALAREAANRVAQLRSLQ